MSNSNLNPILNLKTAMFERTNINAILEQQKMSVRHLHVDFERMVATVEFTAWRDDEARAAAVPPIMHRLTIPLDLADEEVATAVAMVSALIWRKGDEIPFVINYEMVDGKWTAVAKTLTEIGAEIESVDFSELVNNGSNTTEK